MEKLALRNYVYDFSAGTSERMNLGKMAGVQGPVQIVHTHMNQANARSTAYVMSLQGQDVAIEVTNHYDDPSEVKTLESVMFLSGKQFDALYEAMGKLKQNRSRDTVSVEVPK